MTAITLIENFRAVFYTPFYAPAALGAYAAEGLEINITTSPAAARTIDTLIGGDGDVSWGGLSRLMAGLEKNAERVPVAFCEVVGRDPFFLVGHEPNPDFKLTDLLDRTVALVSEVPAPWMCLRYDLHLAGIDLSAIRITPERSMTDNVKAFRAGEIDVIQAYHPFVQQLTSEEAGHIWYAAANRGLASYTTLNTTRDYIARNPDVLRRMCRAVYRTQKWIAANDGKKLAEAVASFFPDIPVATLADCFNSYRALGIWSRSPLLSREGFDWIRDAGLSNGRVRKKYSYEDCADMRFAEQAVNEVELPE